MEELNQSTILAKLGERFTYKQEWLEEWEQFYCEPSYFREFIINRPCVLVGSRGSGKTTTLRCLSYEATKKIRGSDFRSLSDREYFGLFHRADTAACRMFAGPELDLISWRKLFIHYLNLQMVVRMVKLVEAVERDFRIDAPISPRALTKVARLLGLSVSVDSLRELLNAVELAIFKLTEAVNNIGEVTELQLSSLGDAFRLLVQEVKGLDGFDHIAIYYLIDEYENFTEDQQRVINTLVKHCAPDFFIKIGVRDYGFRTKLTLSDDEYLSHPSDYVEISISKNFAIKEYKEFARRVIESRLEGVFETSDLPALFEQKTLADEFRSYVKPTRRREIEREWAEVVWKREESSLLFKVFLIGYLRHRNIPLSKAERQYGKSREKIDVAFHTYAFGIVLNELRALPSNLKKRYGGVETLLDLSGKNIRYFMELIWRSFVARSLSGKGLVPVDVDSQTTSVLEVGETYLRDIEVRGLTGKSVKRFITAVGAVFEGLSREVFSGRPETTQFLVSCEASIDEEIEKADALLEHAVMHGGVLEASLTKAERPGLVKNREYRIFPLFCPFLGFSHRKKRQIILYAREVCLMAADPDQGAKLVLRRLRRFRGNEEGDQQNLF